MSFTLEERRGTLGEKLTCEIDVESPEKKLSTQKQEKMRGGGVGCALQKAASWHLEQRAYQTAAALKLKYCPAVHPGDSSERGHPNATSLAPSFEIPRFLKIRGRPRWADSAPVLLCLVPTQTHSSCLPTAVGSLLRRLF